MSDVVTGLRQVIQDLVAPELKAHGGKFEALQQQIASLQKQTQDQIASLQKLTEVQHDSIMKTMDAFRAEMRSEFAALRASNQMEVYRQISPLSERLAVLEARTG